MKLYKLNVNCVKMKNIVDFRASEFSDIIKYIELYKLKYNFCCNVQIIKYHN